MNETILKHIQIGEQVYKIGTDEKPVPEFIVPITWADLKLLKEESKLLPGQKYRISDYETIVDESWGARSAGHSFDLIVTAITPNTISKDALATHREGDDYFAHCDLSAWKVEYTLDNIWSPIEGTYYYYKYFDDTQIYDDELYSLLLLSDSGIAGVPIEISRSLQSYSNYNELSSCKYFLMDVEDGDVLATNEIELNVNSYIGCFGLDEPYNCHFTRIEDRLGGKGTILKLTDEHNNSAPFDFKNIMFARCKIVSTPWRSTLSDVKIDPYCHYIDEEGVEFNVDDMKWCYVFHGYRDWETGEYFDVDYSSFAGTSLNNVVIRNANIEKDGRLPNIVMFIAFPYTYNGNTSYSYTFPSQGALILNCKDITFIPYNGNPYNSQYYTMIDCYDVLMYADSYEGYCVLSENLINVDAYTRIDTCHEVRSMYDKGYPGKMSHLNWCTVLHDGSYGDASGYRVRISDCTDCDIHYNTTYQDGVHHIFGLGSGLYTTVSNTLIASILTSNS